MILGRRSVISALCIGAALARVATAYLLPNVAHPDETFQYLEQAYRLSTGRGMVPWEYAIGARSWIPAGLITPVMEAGVALSNAPAVHLWAVTLFMIAVACAGVAAAFVSGHRVGGMAHGFLAGLLAAFWCELVYLSPHVLADTLTAVPLVAALAIGYKVEAPTIRRMVWAGTLFGLAFVFRIQLAPAIAIAMLAICGREIKSRYVPMGLGFAGPLALMGVVDWVTLGAPFRSTLVYLRVNAGGVADAFGTTSFFGYIATELGVWGLATPLILITAYLGAKKLPLVAVMVGIILLTFSLIGHKEYRFLYPALPLLFVLCGVGTADIVAWLAARSWASSPRWSRALLAAASTIWLVASIASGTATAMQQKWHQSRGWLDAFRIINADPESCGVGVEPPGAWYLTGLVRLRPDLRLYEGAPHAEAGTGAYNYLLVFEPADIDARRIGAFQLLSCGGSAKDLCVYKRSGACSSAGSRPLQADPGEDIDGILRRLGFLR